FSRDWSSDVCSSDLHMLNIVSVPQRLKDAVGKAGDQEVLHRFLSQIMVDPIDLGFSKALMKGPVELFGRFQAIAEGFFHDQPLPAIVLGVHTRLGQVLGYGPIKCRWGGKVIDYIAGSVVFLLQGLHTLAQLPIIGIITLP